MSFLISIDFGSAYTKVALRHSLDEPSDVVSEETLLDERHICIPSVVAAAQRSGKTRWVCGVDAVDLAAVNGIQVYRNWKPKLFNTEELSKSGMAEPRSKLEQFLNDLDEEVRRAREQEQLIEEIACLKGLEVQKVASIAQKWGVGLEDLRATVAKLRPGEKAQPQSVGTTDLEIREVALEYFRWLRTFVEQACLKMKYNLTSLSNIPVRICTPAFHTGNHPEKRTSSEELLLAVLDEAGWNLSSTRLIVTEPFANAIGTLTDGRNVTWLPKGGQRNVNMPAMFVHGGGLIQAIRTRLLQEHESQPEYVILVVDVGAYTTDFNVLQFNLEALQDHPRIACTSEPLGVNKLDQDVQALLPSEKAEVVAGLTFREREALRSIVYTDMQPYFSKVGRKVGIGEAEEGKLIQNSICEFAVKIAQSADKFLAHRQVARIHELILTGGGNNIPTVRTTLHERLLRHGVEKVHMPFLGKPQTETTKVHILDQRLVRGASALGGASAYIDFADLKVS